jgi:hypothetical protein
MTERWIGSNRRWGSHYGTAKPSGDCGGDAFVPKLWRGADVKTVRTSKLTGDDV